MALLAQSTYTIKKIPKENYRFDLSAETIVVPADASGVVTDYSGAKVDLKLSYDGKGIYPVYDDAVEGRNLAKESEIMSLGTNPTKGSDEYGNYIGFWTYGPTLPRFVDITFEANTQYVLSIKTSVETGVAFYWRYHYTDGTASPVTGFRAESMPPVTKLLASDKNKTVGYLSYTWANGGLRRVYEFKLEKGNTPTPSTPAPEDLDTQITSSLIKKNCDATVSNGILSITNLTADAGYVDVPIDYGVWKQTKRVTIAKSKQGIEGVGISSIVEYYSVSASSTVAPSVWIETIPTLTAVDKYLWNYEKITYTNASFLNTLKKVIGVYGDKGTGGSDGRGIASITNYYLATSASSGVTTGTSGWTIGVQQITTSLKYLWNYEVIKYTTGSDTVTVPAVIGTFGAKGDDGADGKSITLVDVEYGVSASASVLPTVWTTAAPILTGSQQLWTRTKTTYSVGNATYSTPANITPKTGADGAIGTGIDSITEEYYLSSSKTAQTGGSWLTVPPAWINGWYIWTRSKIIYKNPASTVYTTAIVSSEWEAVNDTLPKIVYNYPSGCLVKTDVPANLSAMFSVEIGGNAYPGNINTQLNFYSYSNYTIINSAGTHYAYDIGAVNVFIYEGFVCLWFKQKTPYQSFGFTALYTNSGNPAKNRVTIIQDIGMPEVVDRLITITPIRAANQNDVNALNNNIASTNTSLGNLNTYVDGAFRDGVIDSAEAKSIEQLIKTVQAEGDKIEATYNRLFVNTYLEGAPKTSLLNAKTTFMGAASNVISAINTAIADGKITTTERNNVNTKFNDYKSALASFSTAIENANKAIQDKINQNAQTAADAAAQAAAAAQAKANQAAAVTDKFGTTANGGLISTVMMLLRELNSAQDTAGLSGIQGLLKNNPAFWAGGTYEQAFALINFLSKMSAGTTPATGEYAGLAKITMLHNGAAKIGDFIIEETGKITLVDPDTGKSRLVFSAQNIPLLADLLSSTTFGNSITATSTSLVAPSSGIITSYLVGTLNVEKNGSTIDITGGTHFNLDGLINDSGVSITASLDLMRNDVKYQTLESSVLTYGMDGLLGTVGGRKLTGLPSGTYRLQLSIRKLGTGGNSSAMIVVGSIPMSWSFQQSGIRNFLFGLNGFLSFFSDRHIYFSEEHGFDLRGQTNMPGVLLSTTVSSTGLFANTWGAKKHASLSASKVSTGTYDIYHSIGHGTYNISANAYGNRTISIVSKSSDRCRVQIYNGTTLIDGQFDITLTGNNY